MDRERVRDEMINSIVMTTYNKKMYRVDDIIFNISVEDKFKIQKSNEETSYIDYYQKQWNMTIKEKNQFLLKNVDKRSNQTIFLIPEFCFMTGMTDKMRSDFNLNKDISETTKCPANERIVKTTNLIKELQDPKNERSHTVFKQWKIQ